jgi:hypothetical protein
MTLFGVAPFKLCNGLTSGGGADGGVGTAVFPNFRLGSGVLVVVVVVAALIEAFKVVLLGAVDELDTVEEVTTLDFSSFGFRDGSDEKYDSCIGTIFSLGWWNRRGIYMHPMGND